MLALVTVNHTVSVADYNIVVNATRYMFVHECYRTDSIEPRKVSCRKAARFWRYVYCNKVGDIYIYTRVDHPIVLSLGKILRCCLHTYKK